MERERERERERDRSKFTHGERKLSPEFLSRFDPQLFRRLMGKPSLVARDFLRHSEKETSAREGEQGPFFFAFGRNPCIEVREGKRWRSTMAGMRERVSKGGRVGKGEGERVSF
jgi:hypothetical protein